MPPPLIVTLQLPAETQAYFTALRTQYFPAYINYLEAHLTLFHHLPSDNPMLQTTLEQATKRRFMDLQVTSITNLGKGAAFILQSRELQELHQQLQKEWAGMLIPQDQQKLRPHITIQNKVTAFKAQQTVAQLQQAFTPFSITGIGLQTWLYKKGPWQHVKDYAFNNL